MGLVGVPIMRPLLPYINKDLNKKKKEEKNCGKIGTQRIYSRTSNTLICLDQEKKERLLGGKRPEG